MTRLAGRQEPLLCSLQINRKDRDTTLQLSLEVVLFQGGEVMLGFLKSCRHLQPSNGFMRRPHP